jgi:hypothetical protein
LRHLNGTLSALPDSASVRCMMSESPWLALRQAREAVDNHRPEEAHKFIEPLLVAGYRKAWRLARDVVKEYVSRATRFLDQHNPDAAWRDLIAAEALNTGEKAVGELRQTLVRFGLVQAKAALEAGRPQNTLAIVGKLQDRGVRHPDLARLEAVGHAWVAASEQADRGEFLRALAELDKLRDQLPTPSAAFEQFRSSVAARHAQFRSAVSRLYDAAESRVWREALTAADEVLAVAPEHREAKAIRGKAWVAASLLAENAPPSELARVQSVAAVGTTLPHSVPTSQPVRRWPHPTPQSSPTVSQLPKRFLLWVDGVGGYLVCLANRVTFGQATSDGPVDVPLFADVSRLHAELTRDGEGYVIESGKGVRVNGKEVTRTVLSAGDRVTLGTSCQFLFHKPVSISSTVRLELTSGHRLPVAVDGVLLMGNEVILGPGPNAHVLAPGLSKPVLLYRSRDGLGVRVPGGQFRIDDRQCFDRATLPLPAVVSADTLTFAIETVGNRL